MTTRLAIVLGLVIVGALIYDGVAYDSAGTLFLIRKLADLIEWIAFWR